HALYAASALNLHTLGVRERLSQHLITAADAEQNRPRRLALQDRRLHTALPQPEQILDGILCARQNNHVGIFEFTRLFYIAQRDARHIFKRIKVCEIGNPRKTDHRDIDQRHRLIPLKAFGQAVLVLHLNLKIGGHSHDRNAALFLQHLDAAVQDGLVPAELIDDKPLYHPALILLQEHHGSDQLREHATAVDISDQEDRRFGELRHTHI